MSEISDQSTSESSERNRIGLTLASRLRKSMHARRRCSRHCWWIGGLMVLVGLTAMNLSQVLYAGYRVERLVVMIDICSLSLTILGCMVIVFAPISWFWFHRSARDANS